MKKFPPMQNGRENSVGFFEVFYFFSKIDNYAFKNSYAAFKFGLLFRYG